MRFTKSQNSFKSGRLSPKLFNRIDTKQYQDGASIMQGFRPIAEGGAEVIKGKRWINDLSYNEAVGFTDSKQISFAINGNQISVVITKNTLNDVILYIYKYPYEYGTETSQVLGNNSAWEPDLFDYTVEENYLILTHFSGSLEPRYIKFNKDTGAFEEIINLTDMIGFRPAFSDFKSSTVNIGSWNEGAKTVELTSSDPDTVAILQSKEYFYLEGLGSWVGDVDGRTYSFVASNYYTKQSTIANGIVATYYASFQDKNLAGNPFVETLTFGGVTQVDIWASDIWAAGNWPKSVTSHEGRIVFGGCPENPLSLIGSRVSSISDFNRLQLAETGSDIITYGGKARDTIPTDPYFFKISADEDSEITAVRSSNELFIGTDRKEYIATGGDTILSALSVQIKPYTSQGVYPISTATMGNLVCYLDQSRKKLFQFKFNDANGTFLADELSILFADKLENDRIQQICWAPHVKVLYVLMESEVLYGITYDPSTETQAFFETLQTGVTSISYVAAREELVGESHHRGDHLLMLVRGKGIMTYEQTYFELGITESYVKEDRTDSNEYMFLEDVYEIKRNGANDYSINGQAFAPVNDLFPVPTTAPVFAPPFRAMNIDTGEVVTINSLNVDGFNPWFTIDHPEINGASKILIGNIPAYEKVLATMPVEAGQQYGPAQLGIKNIDEVGIRFYKSYSYKISADGENWQEVRVADKQGNAKTGRKETKFRGNPEYDFRVWIKSDKPEPLVITGINMRGVSNDG